MMSLNHFAQDFSLSAAIAMGAIDFVIVAIGLNESARHCHYPEPTSFPSDIPLSMKHL